jgi:hypothetical protein
LLLDFDVHTTVEAPIVAATDAQTTELLCFTYSKQAHTHWLRG